MTSSAYQLILKLPLKPSFSADSFIETPANWEALQWIKSWPYWPSPFVVFYGDKGCGKTHLAHIWKEQANAHLITLKDISLLAPSELATQSECFIIDGYDAIENEEWLFHFYNTLKESKRYFLLCGEKSPANHRFRLADLQSRLRSLTAIQIRLPDENLLKKLITKLFQDKGLVSTASINDYLLNRIERSYANIYRFVNEINYYSQAMKKPLTLSLVRYVLAKESDCPISCFEEGEIKDDCQAATTA